jgi:hypothetical protein
MPSRGAYEDAESAGMGWRSGEEGKQMQPANMAVTTTFTIEVHRIKDYRGVVRGTGLLIRLFSNGAISDP